MFFDVLLNPAFREEPLKLAKARSLGIKIVSEEEFLKFLA
jgi:NAD-dependent DNA ligase